MDISTIVSKRRLGNNIVTVGTCMNGNVDRAFLTVSGDAVRDPNFEDAKRDGLRDEPISTITIEGLTTDQIREIVGALFVDGHISITGISPYSYDDVEIRPSPAEGTTTLGLRQQGSGDIELSADLNLRRSETVTLASSLIEAIRCIEASKRMPSPLASFVAERTGTSSQNDVRDVRFNDEYAEVSRDYPHLNDIEL